MSVGTFAHLSTGTVIGSPFCLIFIVSLVASYTSYGPVNLNRTFDCKIFSSFSFCVFASVGGRFKQMLSPL